MMGGQLGTGHVYACVLSSHEHVTSYNQPPQYNAPPPPPDCRSVLMETHHPANEMMFCDNGVEPHCAAALLRRGHAATNLMFCKGVEAQCAVSLLNSGQSPTGLMNCKR